MCFSQENELPRGGNFFWNSLIENINWKKAWLLPYKFCIPNKVKELHLRILHNIYPTNEITSKFGNVNLKCNFCKSNTESIDHLFFNCSLVKQFWMELSKFLVSKLKLDIDFEMRDVICYFSHCNHKIEYIGNIFILLAKYFIHKCKFALREPKLNNFLCDFNYLIKTLKIIKNKKSVKLLKLYDVLLSEM